MNKEELAVNDPELLFADGFDDAIIGICERACQSTFVMYDRDACIGILMSKGMDYQGAVDYFEYNVLGAWVGDRTPGFISMEDR